MKPKTHYNYNGYTNEGSNGSPGDSPSPPRSPPRQIRRRFFRSTTYPVFRLESLAAGILLRRNLRYLFLLSLIYVAGLLLCVGLFSQPAPPGSVYRSHEMFRRFWPHIQSDNSSAVQLSAVWSHKRSSKQPKSCPDKTVTVNLDMGKGSPAPTGYLVVEANGGLNQQRSAICNAVAVAGYLNAILHIPRFEYHSLWRDASEFGDIFDEDHFIATLNGYVKVVKELPGDLMERFNNSITNIPNFRVPAWAPVNYYSTVVYPILQKEGVIRIGPFANRLAMSTPPYIQFLRCLTNYRALRFSYPISTLANKLVQRMITKSSKTGGKYVSVHLRFEEDMVAFSGCVYDGGRVEKNKLDLIRESGWKKFKRKDRVIMPGLNRVNGKCPLTPLEVGMMLRGMGFDNNTSIFLASGKIYQAEKYLAPLLRMFPLLHTKESLATKEELAPFVGYSSRLAALDYTVCLFSEVFVTTQGGNFPHLLMGHRRFLHKGHAKTIRPEKRELVVLLEDMNISWNDFKGRMKVMLMASDRQSMLVPRVKKFNRNTSIFAFPLPECSCLQKPENSTSESIDTAKANHLDSAR